MFYVLEISNGDLVYLLSASTFAYIAFIIMFIMTVILFISLISVSVFNNTTKNKHFLQLLDHIESI